ncbi:MAG: flagellar biosynthetic protein FliR [candidate division KSB1 bacterium]|nr:flagellar biosynthetic protein FliR [candidate division KSB1 bacterium]
MIDLFLIKAETFLLVLVRILSFLAVAPFFGHRGFPMLMRTALALVLSFLVFPNVAAPSATSQSALDYAILVGKEVAVGLILGFISQFIFWGVRFGGQILSFLMGFSLVTTIAPDTREQISIIGTFQWLFAITVFLLLDGHFLLIEALVKSFQIVPLVEAKFSSRLVAHTAKLSAGVFVIAVQMSAPVLVTIFMTNISLAMLARMMPQMNVFIVGFPLTISIGFITMIIVTPVFIVLVQHLLGDLRESIAIILRLLGE